MGTRNLTMVIDKIGNLKVAQYGQWDGYPSGQGVTILAFCKDAENLKKLEQRLEICKFYNRCNDIDDWIEEYGKLCPKWSNEPDNRTESMVSWFDTFTTRELGGAILKSIADADLTKLPEEHNNHIYLYDDHEFGKNSLMCEWAFCVNFKTKKLIVFAGFNEDKSQEYELFKTDESKIEEEQNMLTTGYYGCKLVKEYDLNNLPTQEEFVKELDALYEEE